MNQRYKSYLPAFCETPMLWAVTPPQFQVLIAGMYDMHTLWEDPSSLAPVCPVNINVSQNKTTLLHYTPPKCWLKQQSAFWEQNQGTGWDIPCSLSCFFFFSKTHFERRKKNEAKVSSSWTEAKKSWVYFAIENVHVVLNISKFSGECPGFQENVWI